MIKSNPLHIVLGTEKAGSLWNRLLKAATGTFGIQVASMGLSFLISVLLARLLGADGYGTYAYALAWIGLLEVVAVFGQKTILVRNVAAYRTQSAWGLMAGLLRWADRTVLTLSIALVLVAAATIWMFTDHADHQRLGALLASLFLLPVVSLTRLREATLQGLHHVVAGQLPEKIIRPLALILLVGCTYLFLQTTLNAVWVIGLHVIAMGIAFIMAIQMLDKVFPLLVKEAPPLYQTKSWIRSALPIMFIVGMNTINARADILMLGALKDTEIVAVYTVADKGAQFVLFALTAVSVPLNPIISSLYASSQTQRLQDIVTKSTRMVFCISLSIVIGLIVFGNWFLLLFGPDFTIGYLTLAILSLGQLFTVAMGPVGWLLVMTGHQREAALCMAAGTGLNVVLNLMLIPTWGLEGAAIATTISTIVWNLLLATVVRKRLGLHPTVLAKLRV
jgi:O-antigen/teichoic acid export membrane protein